MNRRGTPWRLFGLVALLAMLAYGTALAGVYVFDDIHSVDANAALHDLSNLGRYWTDPAAFSGTSARMYRPALLTSFGDADSRAENSERESATPWVPAPTSVKT